MKDVKDLTTLSTLELTDLMLCGHGYFRLVPTPVLLAISTVLCAALLDSSRSKAQHQMCHWGLSSVTVAGAGALLFYNSSEFRIKL